MTIKKPIRTEHRQAVELSVCARHYDILKYYFPVEILESVERAVDAGFSAADIGEWVRQTTGNDDKLVKYACNAARYYAERVRANREAALGEADWQMANRVARE